MDKGITTSRLNLDELPDAMSEVLTDFSRAQFDKRQAAVQAGAEVFKSAVEQATPKDTGGMAESWEIKTKYKDRRYVGNTKTVSGNGKDNISLSNVLEYSDNPRNGFIRQCFDATESRIFDAIKKKLSGGN